MTSLVTEAFARALASLVREPDVANVLAELLDDAQGVLGASAAGLLLRSDIDGLEVLTATSHRALEIELFQAQRTTGPCVDAIDTGEQVHVCGAEAIVARWPEVGPAIVAAGYVAVHAFPLRWRDAPLGAVNLFYRAETPTAEQGNLPDELLPVAQAFADIAAVVLVQRQDIDSEELRSLTEQALTGRNVIEQAKGVIAYQRSLATDEAYAYLRVLADDDGVTLTAAARAVVSTAAASPTA